MQDIPTIDLAPAASGGPATREAVGQQLDRACRDIGFFRVRGHGIDASVFDDVYTAAQLFFALPAAEKNRCRLPGGNTMAGDPYTPYGYSGLLEENAFAYMGEKDRPSDYVEKFSVGRVVVDDSSVLPFCSDVPGREFRRALKRYFHATGDLSARLMRMMASPLGLAPDFFDVRTNHSNDSLRCHFYPARAVHFSNDQGMGAHMDGSLITLLTHTSPGIQIRTRAGEWIRPEFTALDEYIVNIGDLLAHWTDRQYVSTPHQVVLSDQDRLSIVFFKLTNEDEVVQAGNKQMDALFGR